MQLQVKLVSGDFWLGNRRGVGRSLLDNGEGDRPVLADHLMPGSHHRWPEIGEIRSERFGTLPLG
jgi:hypothetical protein